MIRPDDQPNESADRVSRFKRTVGSVILFIEPVSVQVLSALTMAETKDEVVELLDYLYSILSVPDQPDTSVYRTTLSLIPRLPAQQGAPYK
jgi:hypothetical protein